MEIQFQQQKQRLRGGKFRGIKKIAKSNNKKIKFVGVRQRASGRWVTEIKDTTQNIRMWLGTFETKEEVARAYDEAACLLRVSNTRTNFITHHVSLDSPLAFRIQNLLNNKKGIIKKHEQVVDASSSTSTCTNTNASNNDTSDESSLSSEKSQEREVLEDGYRPDLSNFMKDYCSESGLNKSNFSWGFEDIQNYDGFLDSCGLEISEFERMKVERQISASLYAINGVQEYMDTFQDSNEAFWDLPPLCLDMKV